MRRLVALAACLGLAACAATESTDERSPPADAQTTSLTGTAWQLIEIQSMDDRSYTPGDETYTLSFGDDGRVQAVVDCNRGFAYYFETGDGSLTFGPIALTRMQCPPESLHDRFLAQLGFVRSYVLRDGRLYLATMADGAILEFERIASSQ